MKYNMQIQKSNNQSEILIKLVLALTYNINLKNWSINCINKMTNIYGKIFKGIAF